MYKCYYKIYKDDVFIGLSDYKYPEIYKHLAKLYNYYVDKLPNAINGYNFYHSNDGIMIDNKYITLLAKPIKE